MQEKQNIDVGYVANLARLDLTDEERAMLLNYGMYNAALIRFLGIQNVVNKIDAINSEEELIAARAAYDALSSEDKALVDNYGDLVLAEAENFAAYFLDQTGTICADGGVNADHSAALSGKWSTLSNAWSALNDDVKAVLNNGGSADADDTVADFFARYSHIVHRYGDSYAFSGGPVVQLAGYDVYGAINGTSNDSTVAIVAILVSVAAVAGAGIFLARHRRSN